MDYISSLLQKHQHQIKIYPTRKQALQTLKELAEVRELSLLELDSKILAIILDNVRDSIFYSGNNSLSLYQIIKNEKSQKYYSDIDISQIPLLIDQNDKLLVILNDDIGIVLTNSNTLMQDYKIKRGITRADLDERNSYLLDYLSALENKY
ncbi:Uncharacterised protein [Enterococcus casseliflavus]|uniref:hypothetical protein n=1 Tax=Enterococcus casseliflavus TaxID=37734 RepID=UPI000E05312F|nr:hypothetical protein [Enterococcus casseliflavus]GEB30285.1 hypothetical protein ECA02_33800 [Enterococcus casseliflavus]STP33392.1 Uncharacterised protein [Enterococcus casseliflavus]